MVHEWTIYRERRLVVHRSGLVVRITQDLFGWHGETVNGKEWFGKEETAGLRLADLREAAVRVWLDQL